MSGSFRWSSPLKTAAFEMAVRAKLTSAHWSAGLDVVAAVSCERNARRQQLDKKRQHAKPERKADRRATHAQVLGRNHLEQSSAVSADHGRGDRHEESQRDELS